MLWKDVFDQCIFASSTIYLPSFFVRTIRPTTLAPACITLLIWFRSKAAFDGPCTREEASVVISLCLSVLFLMWLGEVVSRSL